MHIRTLLAATLAALPLTALAESDSPWLPIPGQAALSANYTTQSGDNAYIGNNKLPISAITGGAATKYKRSSTALRFDYGITDALALDATIGYADVKVGSADKDSGMSDSVAGLRWRVLDEFENPAVPTLTLRGAAIIKGNYDGARLGSIGKGANGFEVAAILGKQLTTVLSLWGEIGFQDRSKSVPNATFYELGARYAFAPRLSFFWAVG